jgi:vancomycin resistance protein YoaR
MARLVFAALLAFVLVLGLAAGRARSDEEEPRPPAPVTSTPAPPPRPRTRDPEPKPPPADDVVAAFTTRYPAGEPRVTNIRRAAELLDGTRLRPGAAFSMNAALGERTLERGFVPAPSIVDDRFVDSVGGGISQVATALYNAAFFAGLDLVEHSPHSIYIDRYPLGREATISWGGPELVFRNDWPAPLRMRLRATDTKLTVRFVSAGLGRRVETETSDPIASGGDGFTVEYTRRVYRYDELIRKERFRTRYER